jgi:hypothetical protein
LAAVAAGAGKISGSDITPGLHPNPLRRSKSLMLLALPREADEPSKIKDLLKGLGQRSPIEFQWISQTSPKPLQRMAGGFAAEWKPQSDVSRC